MVFQEQVQHYCDMITVLTGVRCTLLDATEKKFCQPFRCACPLQQQGSCQAEQVHQSGCEEAVRWNGHYLYHCSCGFAFLATVLRQPRLQREYAMITGPFLSEKKQKTVQLPEREADPDSCFVRTACAGDE